MLGEVAGAPGLHRGHEHRLLGERGEHHHLRFRVSRLERAGGGHPVAVRQLVVEQHDVGRVYPSEIEQLGHATGDTDHVDVGLSVEQRGQAVGEDGVVVADQHVDARCRRRRDSDPARHGALPGWEFWRVAGTGSGDSWLRGSLSGSQTVTVVPSPRTLSMAR